MIDLNQLHPLIVPAEYYQSEGWDLPHATLPNEEFILTWVEFGEALLYLDRAGYNELEASSPGWQQKALDNVRQTQYFHRNYHGEPNATPDWIAFLNDEDTISSSKVLLNFELSRIFPDGYHIAIPDRACGIVVSNTCSDAALQQVVQLIETMYNSATTPMSPQLYSSADFQLPASWAAPITTDTTSAAILALFGVD